MAAPISSKRGGAVDASLPPISFTGFETRALHAGCPPDAATGARTPNITPSTAFVFNDSAHGARLFALEEPGMIYSRLTNPTVMQLGAKVADLEGGIMGVCTSCGHSAQLTALYALMHPGDKIIASKNLYGGTVTQFSRTILKYGWSCDFVDCKDIEAVKKALAQPNVKALFVESLANPGGVIVDLKALADAAHAVEVPLLVDNTLATPYLCRPIEHGADIVIHSLTKYMCGHGNAMGGIIVDGGKFDWSKGKFKSLAEPEPAYHGLNFSAATGAAAFSYFCIAVGLRDLGCCLAPMNAWLIMMGVETLALRMEKHCENALKVAQYLEKHPEVSWVSYPSLPDSPYKALADKYVSGKGGAVLTFGLKKGFDACVKVANSVQLFSHLANLGDTRSLIIHPASTTHSQLSDEQKMASGAQPEALRLCVGIENIEDIIKDLDRSLGLL
eukprot:CAMPEP_0206227754 /NCGR_PEP_ID=MMETSP0047_2-20121206/8796_1 /ASSEMBLY_ACC=CAM_ASM_000192 /TAXON_ID=195065 /ORGANISM="Chroomonas mesostigmatica_cf, Strain CCMP1168" /LENGTH=444 /DNA_ID=CAMNT_0053650935 /DNA_START=37 /DNA_END=1371 /DNA_ORIENTATION=+